MTAIHHALESGIASFSVRCSCSPLQAESTNIATIRKYSLLIPFHDEKKGPPMLFTSHQSPLLLLINCDISRIRAAKVIKNFVSKKNIRTFVAIL
jgi:hypothetical protein